MKCEVLNDTVIAIQKGSIVFVTDRQFELARKVLKPIVEDKPITTKAEPETIEVRKTKKKK